jgi:hypothetical protein
METRNFKLATAKYAATVLARYLVSGHAVKIVDCVTTYCEEPSEDKLVELYDLLFEGLDNEQTVGPTNLVVGTAESDGVVDRPNTEPGTT